MAWKANLMHDKEGCWVEIQDQPYWAQLAESLGESLLQLTHPVFCCGWECAKRQDRHNDRQVGVRATTKNSHPPSWADPSFRLRAQKEAGRGGKS